MALGMVSGYAEVLDITVVPYADLVAGDLSTVAQAKSALYKEGIVGVKGVPGYTEAVSQFIHAARAFSSLSEEEKELCAPRHDLGDLFLGYEKGREKFKRPDGRWVVDDLKVSYYAFVPENPANKWPASVERQTPFEQLGTLMSDTGVLVMERVGLVSPSLLEGVPRVTRMLHYRKSADTRADNPFWCGSHPDPRLLLRWRYPCPEPEEAGLFVLTGNSFKKVLADPEVMLFQVGEFGQLLTNDAIRATEHCVQKAQGSIERYTMALFFDLPPTTTISSQSLLIKDARYAEPCVYRHWVEESFKRYIVEN
jgi:isopenicillin N synthase-like dioxygenase